jgi:hypothetical protein
MATDRPAEVSWQGSLMDGSRTIERVSSSKPDRSFEGDTIGRCGVTRFSTSA